MSNTLVPYDSYADIAKCSLTHYIRYARLFFYLYAFQTILMITLTSLTTVLHAIPGYDELGYCVGFAASVVIAINAVIPLRDASKQSTEASVVLARHIQLREPMSGKVLYNLTNTSSLWLSHPTTFCAKINSPRSVRSTGRSLNLQAIRQTQNSSGLTQNPNQTRQSRSQFVGESGQTITRNYVRPSAQSNVLSQKQSVTQTNDMRCVIIQFDVVATRLFSLYYLIITIQIIFTTASALFHAFKSVSSTINIPDDTARGLGIAFGGFATLLGAILATFPIEIAARQCRQAYALSFEYFITNAPVPAWVLDCLYEVNTLCFSNPIFKDNCVQVVGGSEMQTLPVTDTSRNIMSPRL
tara:strand:+ start:548 stop:1612 length:1065 start_codon:yes stop_codon:yes gene_type:complete